MVARAAATILLVQTGVEARLDASRDLLATLRSECAAGAWNGMLVIRLLAADTALLRRDMVACLAHLRSEALPRVWQC